MRGEKGKRLFENLSMRSADGPKEEKKKKIQKRPIRGGGKKKERKGTPCKLGNPVLLKRGIERKSLRKITS